MRALAAAISTLTIFPLGRFMSFSEADLRASVRYFPLVGLALGALLRGEALALHLYVSPLPLAALTLLVSVVFTGALHLDGLADLADGLGAGGDPQRILAVMKDSRTGAFGVIALTLTLILKFAFFHELIGKGRFNAFLLVGLLSRWAMAFAAFLGTYPRATGTGKALVGQIGLPQSLGASSIAALLSWLIFKETGLLTMAAIALWTLLFVRVLRAKIGGLTGDGLGALNEITENLVLLILVITGPLTEMP